MNKTPRFAVTGGRFCACLLSVFLAIFFHPTASLAAPDSQGTDFWVAFPSNLSSPELSLFITGNADTTGVVEIPGLAFSTPFAVTAGTVTTVTVPSGAQLAGSDVVESKGIHVTALAEVTVYGLNRVQFTTDAYLGLPTDILDTDYVVLGYQNSNVLNASLFAVVAAEDATTVTITPSVTTGARPAGVPYDIALNQGETYQLINNASAPADLSGTFVTADKPIAVFGGHQCANIPPGATACDHVVEQLTPTTTWGKNFVTMPLATRLNGDTFRFLAAVDGTTISINGAPVATINRGQVWEQIVVGPAQIIGDQPILVAQYSNGSSYDGVTSDPFMMLVPPFEQFLDRYTVTTPASGFSTNFINVVVPNAAVGTTNLDGVAIPAGSFTAIGATGFSGAQLPVALGSHNLTGSAPFGVFVYGFDSFDSYGYPGGMSLAPVATVTGIALSPLSATNPIGAEHCVTATVTDQNANPVAGVRVDFGVTGANTASGSGTTAENGQAVFCYVGNNAGDDTITASVGTLSATASKTWQSSEGGKTGSMKGGGAIWGSVGKITHGFVLWCQPQKIQLPNRLQANWGRIHSFHLTHLESGSCADDPAISEGWPRAGFDTYTGRGTGRYNGKPGATAEWVITDAGEPGFRDSFTILIRDANGTVVLNETGTLKAGDHQALPLPPVLP